MRWTPYRSGNTIPGTASSKGNRATWPKNALNAVLRIGINLGDVMVEGGDLYGDGVNIAARLEAMAEPGAVNHVAGIGKQVPKSLTGLRRDVIEQGGAEDLAAHLQFKAARLGGDRVRNLEAIVPPAVPHLALRRLVRRVHPDVCSSISHVRLLRVVVEMSDASFREARTPACR